MDKNDEENKANSNEQHQPERQPRARPTMELYKPPVLRSGSISKKSRPVERELVPKVVPSADKLCVEPVETVPSSNLPKSLRLVQEMPMEMRQKAPPMMKEPPEFEEVVTGLEKQLEMDASKVGQFLMAQLVPFRQLAEQIGEFLVKHIIEDLAQRQARKGILSRAFVALASTPVAATFCQGVVRALGRYFECREALRREEEYGHIWMNFLALTFELGQIALEESVVQLIFHIFAYLLSPPVLDSLKISELESSLSLLLAIGRRMEQEFPAQLAELKELIRDAFLNASEAWVRKMLLLMVELGAGEWRMTADLEEYYFQQ